MKHDCPIPGCEQRIPTTLLMCTAHWLAVPASLRRDVNRTWRAYRRARQSEPAEYEDQLETLRAYRDARDEAIKTVAESEMPLCD